MNNCKYCNKETKNPKFCSRSCAQSFNNKGVRRHKGEKPSFSCRNCGKIGDRKNSYYCSNKCQQEFQYKTYINKWVSGKKTKNLSKYIRRYLIEQKEECWECGIKEWNDKPLIIEVDHIDGNAYNNDINNLRRLCPNCHSQTSTFRNLGGRKSVRTYRSK